MTDQGIPPTETPFTGNIREPSLVLINTGDGKGKSTAAFGTAMRAVARGWKVVVIQFLKSGEWSVGEEKIGRQIGIEWWALGDGFTWDSEDMDESQAVARAAWASAKEKIESGQYHLVVLDEVTYPINWGWLDVEEVVSSIQNRPEKVNVILTGRDAPDRLIEIADTVTEMTKIKHAFDRGVMARRGIDY
ncbi:MAG: cob(I)yrinic acid a,c-diamide adenosyltransferase [Actinobacteria bacterium]|jgi:cob(I)alamin adenosyltransferase|nr:cob(I)yrinic acid a,c-diamide adenosyltransferase [Actinomycetota bacterium]MCZ6568473.1 cob(I)yrinic acid a,c-diamide adenosyltransferase [Actinomycetota bacterium]MCZ6630159.1 cob(I)yrinic acid a,c-diamide adenosyltransferase [Actinomycetota bacterium]